MVGRTRAAGSGSGEGGRQWCSGPTSGRDWTRAHAVGEAPEELEEPFAVPNSSTLNTDAARCSTHSPRRQAEPLLASRAQGQCDTQQGIRPPPPTPGDPLHPGSSCPLNHKQFCKQPHSPTPALVRTLPPAKDPTPTPTLAGLSLSQPWVSETQKLGRGWGQSSRPPPRPWALSGGQG